MPTQPSLEKSQVVTFRLPQAVAEGAGRVALVPANEPTVRNSRLLFDRLLGDPRSPRRRAMMTLTMVGTAAASLAACAKPGISQPQRAPHGANLPAAVAPQYAPDEICSSVDKKSDVQAAIATIMGVDPSTITSQSCEQDSSLHTISRGTWYSTEDGRNLGVWIDQRLDDQGRDTANLYKPVDQGGEPTIAPYWEGRVDGDGNQTYWKDDARLLKVFPKGADVVLNVQFTGGEIVDYEADDAVTLGQFLSGPKGIIQQAPGAAATPAPGN